jgi:hypothetical protein
MPRIPFYHLPPASRLWIFPANRKLTPGEESRLLATALESGESEKPAGASWHRRAFFSE